MKDGHHCGMAILKLWLVYSVSVHGLMWVLVAFGVKMLTFVTATLHCKALKQKAIKTTIS